MFRRHFQILNEILFFCGNSYFRYAFQKPNKMSAPLEFVPPREVQKEFLAQFSLLRDKIESCRTTGNIPSPPVRLVSCNFYFFTTIKILVDMILFIFY